jgi:phosphate transport system substrate-binding protein
MKFSRQLITHFPRLLLGMGILLFGSCSNSDPKTKLDSATSGEITIAVDETFAPILDSQVYTFESLYPEAIINIKNLSESEGFRLLDLDSVRLMVSARELRKDELEKYKQKKIYPVATKIAYDALALIIHPENSLENINYPDLRDIFSGKFNQWDSLEPKNKLGALNIVFDNSGSSTARYIKEHFLDGNEFPKNCFAVKTNEEVIKYVAEHKQALGIIGVNWISDSDDPATQKFKASIKVVGVSNPEGNLLQPEYFKPYQAYIALKKYPLTRSLYIISREGRMGLGSGFSAFVAGDKGQRIILKSGLMPATSPIRIVGFR